MRQYPCAQEGRTPSRPYWFRQSAVYLGRLQAQWDQKDDAEGRSRLRREGIHLAGKPPCLVFSRSDSVHLVVSERQPLGLRAVSLLAHLSTSELPFRRVPVHPGPSSLFSLQRPEATCGRQDHF